MPPSCEVLSGGDPLIAAVRSYAATPTVRRIRLALGYLFVPGLLPIWDALEASSATDIQLLIGNTAGVLTDEQRFAAATAAGAAQPASVARVEPEMDMAATARAERDRIVTETAEALRENLRCLPNADPTGGGVNAEDFLGGLARAIGANRLHVRIYPDGRLHAKASLFDSDRDTPMIAVVGSSNLTLPAHGNPTELNVAVATPDALAAVNAWYETLWDAGQDFTRALFAEVSARVPPRTKPTPAG